MGDERALLLGGLLALCAWPCSPFHVFGPNGARMAEVILIHRDSAFYFERPEPEETLVGWLRYVPVVTGPETRDLPIHFEDAKGSFPLYVVGPDVERLRSLIDRRVRLVGRRVDLRGEGGAIELWPALVWPFEDPGID